MINLFIAVIIDWIIGDPNNFPHPVKLMGKIITLEENLVRKLAKSNKSLKICGLIMVITNISLGFFLPFYLLKSIEEFQTLYTILEIYLIYSCIAARCLHKEAILVSKALDKGVVEGRKRLSYIVGRDTTGLTAEKIVQATVETVAENTSDGVVGPLLYISLLGAAGGLAYKFINTMDSMLGYMDDKFRDLGYFSAKTDDLFNLIPARLTGLLMNITSIGRFDFKNGLRIMSRDKRNHKSPNSGYPESTVAGLLGIQLGGGNYYNGNYVDKPTIGDSLNLINKNHIKNTIEIMYRAEIGFLIIYYLLNI